MNPLAELKAAEALLTAENYDGAMRQVESVLKDYPDLPHALFFATVIEFRRGNYKEALHRSREQLSVNPLQAETRVIEAISLAKLGKKKEAKNTLQKFEKDFPDRQSDIDSIATHIFFSAGKQRKALQKLHDIRQDPQARPADKSIAILMHRMGDLFAAQNELQAAFDQDPNDFKVAAALANNNLLLGRLSAARKFAHVAQRIEPGNRNLNLLIFASYMFYLPPLYLALISVSMFRYINSKKNIFFSAIIAVPIYLIMINFIDLCIKSMEIFGNFRFDINVTLIIFVSIFAMNYCSSQFFLQSIREKTIKAQKLENY
ncbi:tetratricopeptide repeat protein [Roseibium album]|uniref:tetratricopeptide repeat protein n=1 Tax=Roseibium album TaxID=311410 RepID=UPI003296A7DC